MPHSSRGSAEGVFGIHSAGSEGPGKLWGMLPVLSSLSAFAADRNFDLPAEESAHRTGRNPDLLSLTPQMARFSLFRRSDLT